MKKIAILTLSLLLLLSVIPAVYADGAQMLFVAPDGSDQNTGEIDKPFATIERAVQAAAQIKGRVVINLREGVYCFDRTLALTAEHSDLVIRPYMDEAVTITAANRLESSAFQKVTNAVVLERILDEKARDQVYCLDLREQGINDYGEILPHGYGEVDNTYGGELHFPPALYYDDQIQTLARYPNNGYLETGAVTKDGSTLSAYKKDGTFEPSVFTVNDDRLKKWSAAEEIWSFGYFKHDWAESNVPVTLEGNTVTTQYPVYTGVVSDRRLYFYNLLEEIDTQGEWYLDRTSGMLYLYPYGDIQKAKIELATFGDPLVTLSGCENVEIKGITFEKSVGEGVKIDRCKNVVLADCEFTNISFNCVWLTDSYDCKITGNYIHDVGALAIKIIAGDTEKMIPGNCVVENNKIHSYAKIKTTYADAISLNGVANVARNNQIYDAPHVAMGSSGWDHVFEYNDISQVCRDTADSGAIYIGGGFAKTNYIRYNYFHDLAMIDTNTGMQMQAVYLDDEASNNWVYGNFFYDVDSVALYGGGRFNTFVNNVMLNCKKPFVFDNRGMTWQTNAVEGFLSTLEKASQWAEKYPQLLQFEDDPGVPKYNTIAGNVEYKSAGYNINENVVQHGTVENNIELKNTNSFADYKNGDFTVLKDSEITKKIPDFEIVDFNRIGLRDEDIAKVEASSTIMLVDSPRAWANGAKTLVDPQNIEVVPLVIDERTLVPVRMVSESFGAKVGWEENTQTVDIQSGTDQISLRLGSNKMLVNGRESVLDVAAQTINDRTLIPLRAIVEALGKQVFWDDRGLIVISDTAGSMDAGDDILIEALVRSVSMD